MIQRKQTLFLLGVFIAVLLCLFFPVASTEPVAMGDAAYIFNLGVKCDNAIVSFASTPLFVLLSLSGAISLVTIFLYKKRKLQIKLCLWAVAFLLLWYGYYALLVCKVIVLPISSAAIRISFTACLPLVAIILLFMARSGIKHDEKLVRAADRIR